MAEFAPGSEVARRARLGEFGVCWMQVHCGCGRSCTVHIQLLMDRHGAGTHVGAILPRLRCKQCHQPPQEARLTERPDAGALGGARVGWIVPLIGAVEANEDAAGRLRNP